MKLQSVTLLCITFLFMSCGTKKNEAAKKKPTFTIPLKRSQQIHINNFKSFFSDVRVIPLNPKNGEFVSSISKVIVYQSLYFVLDERFSQLFCFNENGTQRVKYGDIGLGLNQYKKISDFDILDDQIAVLSNDDQAIIYYDLRTGKFKKRRNIELFGNSISLLSKDSCLIFINQNSSEKSGNKNVLLINEKDEVIRDYFPFNKKNSSMGITFSGFMLKANNEVLYSSPFDEVVYRFHNGNFDPYMRWEINNQYINLNKENLKNIVKETIIRDPKTSFLRNILLKNKNYIIGSFQDSITLKYCFYNIKKKTITILDKTKINDPYLLLLGTPVSLNEKNEVTFSISPETIYNLRQAQADIYNELDVKLQAQLSKLTKSSNPLLMICKIK